MKAIYNMTINLIIAHEIDKIDENLKNDNEMAADVCKIICDEAAMTDAVVVYEVVKSSIDVR